jgi:hypothetical protein
MDNAPMTPSQLHDIVSWNDMTIGGVLIALVLAFGAVIYFLFKANQTLYKEFTAERDRLYKEHLNEIRSFNEALLRINNQYSEAIQNLSILFKK